jgi:hypothetical protein
MRGPVTQTLRLRFRPTLRYFDERVAIVRRFDELDCLRGFTVEAEDVRAALDGFRWLSITPSGVTFDILDPAHDRDASWAIVEDVCTALGPLTFSHARVSYQHLVALPLSFEEAVARGRRRLMRDLSTDEVTLDDWALLSTVNIAGPHTAAGMIEFGTVRRDEIQVRLARAVGRGPGMLHIGERDWPLQDFGDVSLYADTDLASVAAPGREQAFLDDAAEFWDQSRDQMTRLIDGWCSELVANRAGGE